MEVIVSSMRPIEEQKIWLALALLVTAGSFIALSSWHYYAWETQPNAMQVTHATLSHGRIVKLKRTIFRLSSSTNEEAARENIGATPNLCPIFPVEILNLDVGSGDPFSYTATIRCDW